MKLSETMEKLAETTIVTKRELVLGAAACTLAGVVTGMLITKITTGWSINLGSGNGCGNCNNGNDNHTPPMPPRPHGRHECGRKGKHAKPKCCEAKTGEDHLELNKDE